jgi:hypothetical protein
MIKRIKQVKQMQQAAQSPKREIDIKEDGGSPIRVGD